MFQLDDKFLQDVGLGGLPEEQKKAFLQHIYDELELRVGAKLSEGLTEEQLTEFEGFVNQDSEKVTAWLNANAPNYANSEEYQKFVSNAPSGTSQVTLAAEYASLKWLEHNRPDYKQVVSAELNALRQEVIQNKDQILQQNQGSSGSVNPSA